MTVATEVIQRALEDLQRRRQESLGIIKVEAENLERYDDAIAALRSIVESTGLVNRADPVTFAGPAPKVPVRRSSASSAWLKDPANREKGAAKWSDADLAAKAKELGVFSMGRLAEATGIPRGSITPYKDRLLAAGTLVRHGSGTGVYFTHRDYAGPHSAKLARGVKPSQAADDSERLRSVRDFVVKQRSPFGTGAVAAAIGTDTTTASQFLSVLQRRGVVRSTEEGWVYDKPVDPGPVDRRPAETAANGHRNGAPVPGTGRAMRVGNADGDKLAQDVRRAGGRVVSGGKHPVVEFTGTDGGTRRIPISSSPGDVHAQKNARQQLRDAGLNV